MIRFLPSDTTAEFTTGNLPYQGEGCRESLLDVALNHHVDLMHLCGGMCACITCHVIVEQGDQNLSPVERDEEDCLYRVPDFTLHSRLACRAVVRGDVTVRIPPRAPSG
ncbi:MAG: 2Fe-2S iron-sulfur cluster binding domain-containing protein [Acidobacteria bacterium]|nr:2Fe-2S iron-sulfur cluster binding domain-containing protein [Acidobacteriota bacterium]